MCTCMGVEKGEGMGTLNTVNVEQTWGALDASSAKTVTTSIASSSVSRLEA